eukprot:COSAG02_NODE_5929_length_3935_cov_4.714286_6_plen_186_part_00
MDMLSINPHRSLGEYLIKYTHPRSITSPPPPLKSRRKKSLSRPLSRQYYHRGTFSLPPNDFPSAGTLAAGNFLQCFHASSAPAIPILSITTVSAKAIDRPSPVHFQESSGWLRVHGSVCEACTGESGLFRGRCGVERLQQSWACSHSPWHWWNRQLAPRNRPLVSAGGLRRLAARACGRTTVARR